MMEQDREKLKKELRDHVARVERHRSNAGLSDSQLVTRYAKYLGSPKTWTDRLRGGELEELGNKLPHWVAKLRALVELIEGRASSLTEFYDSMPFARDMNSAFDRLMGQRSDRRCVVALATTGCGKSSWGTKIAADNPRTVAYVQCAPSWHDRPSHIVNGLGRAIGCNLNEWSNFASRFELLMERLKLGPICLVIDDAHEAGVYLLKLVKYMIDQTQSRFVLLAYPTLWRKVLSSSDSSQAEARQLFGRVQKPVFDAYANGVMRDDVVTYLREAAGLGEDVESTAGQILPLVKTNGNLRLLADAVEAAQLQADVLNQPLTGQVIVERVNGLCPSSARGQKGVANETH